MNTALRSGIVLLCLSGFVYSQIIQDQEALRLRMAEAKTEQYTLMHELSFQYTDNQDNYDVKYYDLNLNMDVLQKMVSGHVSVLAEVINTTINRFDLNFLSNMVVDSILQEGVLRNYTHADDIIEIDLGTDLSPGEMVDISVYYHGHPEESVYRAFGFGTIQNKPMIWSKSEPFGARAWWPCKDFPCDKADSVDIKVTVPSELIVASNGLLREVEDRDSVKTYWWHEKYPIATYLVSVAIYPYTVYTDYYQYTDSDSMEVQLYVYEPLNSTDREGYRKTIQMLEIFSNLFGEYPFIEEKYGHAVADISAAGMEHQTLTSIFNGPYESLNVHELAHQWWGDMVTCDNFSHIWLNEGFATYAEALYEEKLEGTARYHQKMQYTKFLGSGTVFRDGLDPSTIFNSNLSYKKASWVLHMLRHIVGSPTFFNILKAYGQDTRFQYGSATTEDFQSVCKQVSGLNLEKFFHQWIYEEYYPTYAYTWNWTQNGSSYNIVLEIQQLQTNHIFWMPIDVRVTTTNETTAFVIMDSLQTQTFQLTVDSEPVNLTLDRDEWILRVIREPMENPSFDKGILLMNGFGSFASSDQMDAFENRTFWGDFPVSLWDCDGDYWDIYGFPATLPAPLGEGKIPNNILGQYSTVIFVGNGDEFICVPSWTESSMLDYLKAGGNILLISPYGRRFFQAGFKEYLGIEWAEASTNTVENCISTFSGLLDMDSFKTQSRSAVFDTTLNSHERTLLFMETTTFSEPRGLGVWYKPEAGGSVRANGGQMVFISGMPERFDHNQLRSNVEYILENFFYESKTPVIPGGQFETLLCFELNPCYPNPFNESTMISYSVPAPVKVRLAIYNLLGEEIECLVDDFQDRGHYKMTWKANVLPSGVYLVRLKADGFTAVRKMVLMQ